MTTKNLLVAVDFSEASNLVVDKARELAQELSARVVLLHVMEPKAVPVPKRDSKGAIGAAWPLQTPKRLSGIKARLNSLAKPLKVLGIEVESIAVAGLLLDEILDQAGKYHPWVSWPPGSAPPRNRKPYHGNPVAACVPVDYRPGKSRRLAVILEVSFGI